MSSAGQGSYKNGDRSGSFSEIDVWAPYNFVPLSQHVWIPDWGKHVSHDVPFADGYSGELDVEITAQTPIMIGGHRQDNPTSTTSGIVSFFTDCDGKPAIPGSSLKGLIRSTAEMASFARYKIVDDKTYAVRDLTNGGRDFYQSKLVETSHEAGRKVAKARSEAGFLYLQHGEWYIQPCENGRIEQDQLNAWGLITKPNSQIRNIKSYVEKMSVTKQPFVTLWVNPRTVETTIKRPDKPVDLKFKRFDDSNASPTSKQKRDGDVEGLVVLTGQVRTKHREFVFYGYRDAASTQPEMLDPHVMNVFLSIHQDDADDAATPWGYWWTKLRQKEIGPGSKRQDLVPGIPVFYLRDAKTGKIIKIGLSQMFKLPYDYSVHDMIGHTSPEHLRQTGFDMADLLFGRISEDGEQSLKGRVSFGLCKATSATPSSTKRDVLLNSPKASYYPFYIKQSARPDQSGNLNGPKGHNVEKYQTYMESDPRQKAALPELRGWKRYLPRDKELANDGRGAVGNEQQDQSRLMTTITPLSSGTSFRGKVRFHNLRKAEIGLLVTALTTQFQKKNEAVELRGHHLIGMAKPYGLGRIELSITQARLEANQLSQDSSSTVEGQAALGLIGESIADFVEAFETSMPEVEDYYNSEQIRALAEISNVDKMTAITRHFDRPYMDLPRFMDAKGAKERQGRALTRLPRRAQ